MMRRAALLALALLPMLAAGPGCAVNPVTGRANFQLYGVDWERQVGAQMFAPMKQAGGGEFILDPQLTAYVQEVGSRLATRARRADELQFEFAVLNDSVPNAWALPGGKIVVNRGLLTELESEAELAAVLGHEIVHADAAHGARAQSKGMITQSTAVISMIILGSTINDESAREVAMMVPALGAQLLTQKYGRDAERESDEYGMRYMAEAGYDPAGAVQLQETFLRLSEGRDPDWLSGLFASHPPSRERVENNRRTAQKLGISGAIETERYQARTAYLRRVQPAYEAFDEARTALADGDREQAQRELDRALAIEPRESLFHALQGDIHALAEASGEALASYDRAIAANPDYFYGYLRRGQLSYHLGEAAQARDSLVRSVEILPTAEAHYLLGNLDRDGGDMSSAVGHYRAAAGSDSESGRRALDQLVLFDLPANPANYIPSQAAVDSANEVWVQFGNRTRLAVADIEISYAWLDSQGRTQQGKQIYPGPLAGGQQDRLRLGIVLDDPAELDRRVRVQVTSARPLDPPD
jgi:predicted Zn-dependent protease